MGDARAASRRSVRRGDQFAIAVFRHPACPREMRVVDMAAAQRIASGVEAEKDLDGLSPVGSIARRVQQTQIEGHMLKVIGRERLADGRLVEEWRRRLIHRATIIARRTFVNTVAGNSDDRTTDGANLRSAGR